MAGAGLTHVADLLTGYASGEILRWLTYRSLTARCASKNIPLPCSEHTFNQFQHLMQPQWLALIRTALSRPHCLLGLRDLINLRPPPESAWGRADFAPRGGHLHTSVCPPLARAFQQFGDENPQVQDTAPVPARVEVLGIAEC